MLRQNRNKIQNIILVAFAIAIVLLIIFWPRYETIRGEVYQFLPVSQELRIRFHDLKPSSNTSADQTAEFSEVELQGAWLKMESPSDGLYILRVMPQCKFDRNNYFFIKKEDKPDISRKSNEFVSQVERDGKKYDMYLKYEDINRVNDLDKIYFSSPLKYEAFGKRVSKRSLLNSKELNERERSIVRNLPARSRIIDVVALSEDLDEIPGEFRESDLSKYLPWLLLLLLLLLLLFNWRRLYNLFKPKFMAPKKNLEEFGYVSSGQSGGDPVQFRSFLNGIYNGDLSDDNKSVLTENQIGRIQTNIKELDQGVESNKLEIEELKKGENLPMFDPVRFAIALIIFIGLTIFSYFFYLSTINKALFVNYDDCDAAEKLAILPNQVELALAVQNSWIILIVPFTVFALGWILHMVIDNPTLKTGQRFLYLGSILLVTFVLDFLLASFIHKNINDLKEYCGYGTSEVWYLSTTFYIIIFMGFMVYIFWSMILYYLLQQVEKRSKKRAIHNSSEKLKFQIRRLKKRKDRQNKLLENGIGNISGSIDTFHLGWNMYMNNYPERFAENQKKCETIRNEFKNKISKNNE